MIIFETERLIVRPYTPGDKDHFFLLNSNEEVVRYIRAPKSREEADAFLLEVLAYTEAHPGMGRLAVIKKDDQQFIGSFAIIPVDNSDRMQLGYALLPPHWGYGYATELTMNGLRYVFTKTPLDRIYAYTEPANLPSQRVLLKAGFIQIGKKMEGEKELLEFLFEKDRYRQP